MRYTHQIGDTHDTEKVLVSLTKPEPRTCATCGDVVEHEHDDSCTCYDDTSWID